MVRFSDIIRKKSEKKIEMKSSVNEAEKDRRLKISPYYEKFLERAIDIRERVKNDTDIDTSPIISDLNHITNNDFINDLYEYTMSTPGNYEEMIAHTVYVTFASLRIGKGMGYDNKMIIRLGLAAFLENVGMYKIPDSILREKGKLDEREIKIVREHPKISYQIIGGMGEKYRWLAKVALQVHERSDGSGYPMGLKGEEISDLASIIGLIETYMALIKNRPYREKLVQPYAIKFIIKEAKRLFPTKILKVFFNEISLFPVNTYVRLNNNSIGRVRSTIQNMPLRPTIELLYDSQKNKMKEHEIIKLSENPLLYIADIIDEKDLP